MESAQARFDYCHSLPYRRVAIMPKRLDMKQYLPG
jgi:hypothetical protein